MGERRGFPLDFSPPVRRVHASIKPSHLLGSFKERGYQPGELALAHGGLFIADEFMEWPRDSKECLREPLQSKKIFLTRIFGQIECPSDFQMVATGNLCPCGGLPPMFRTTPQSQKFKCSCKPPQIVHYLSKLSGPMLDRIDLTFVMHDPKSNTHSSSSLTRLRAEIEKARVFSMKHFGALPSELTPACLDQGPTFEKLLTEIMSLRTRHKILRVARSIQALEQSETLKEEHVFEAKCYRMPEIGEYYAS